MSFLLGNSHARFMVGMIKRRGYVVDCLRLQRLESASDHFHLLPGILLRATPRNTYDRVIAVLARNWCLELAEVEAATRLLDHVNQAMAFQVDDPAQAAKLQITHAGALNVAALSGSANQGGELPPAIMSHLRNTIRYPA